MPTIVEIIKRIPTSRGRDNNNIKVKGIQPDTRVEIQSVRGTLGVGNNPMENQWVPATQKYQLGEGIN